MKIKLFTIPNFITLSNLICGVLAINEVIANQDYTLAFWLIVLAAVFDFFDGFVARLLGEQSLLGVQLDSLSDLVSFGLAPSFVLFSLAGEQISDPKLNFLPYLTFIVVAFAALRLAKFNIDDSQHDSFEGLPTPANALFCMSLGMISAVKGVSFPTEWIVATGVAMALFMVAPLRMFSLKFKGFGLKGNGLRYGFLALAVLQIATLRLYALPAVVASYVLISGVVAYMSRRKA